MEVVMDERELQAVLGTVVATSAAPPPMSATAVLEAGRRARRTRRVASAGAGSVVAATAVTVAAVAFSGGTGGPAVGTFGAPPVTPGAVVSFSATAAPDTDASKPVWPTGPDGIPQSDRTAKAGPRYDQGVRLLTELVAAVPAGYTALDGPGTDPVPPLRYQQAQFDDRVNGTDVWSYSANVAVAHGAGTGSLLAEVHTAGNTLPTEPCQLTWTLWGMQGDCQVVTVGTASVGVVVRSTGNDRRYDRWAAYRHPDGVVVYIAEAKEFDPSRPALSDLPFSAQQLAEFAVADRFHLV
jgi:hypothetical protein